MAYSFNRVRTAALKSIANMQERLKNIEADFGDVDMFLVGEAKDCRLRLDEFVDVLKSAQDPLNGSREIPGYTFNKVRRGRKNKTPAHDLQQNLF